MERLRETPEKTPGRTVFLIKDGQTGSFTAYVPSMPGCISQGSSRKEALDSIQFAMNFWSEVSKEKGFSPLTESKMLILKEVAISISGGHIPQLATVPDPW